MAFDPCRNIQNRRVAARCSGIRRQSSSNSVNNGVLTHVNRPRAPRVVVLARCGIWATYSRGLRETPDHIGDNIDDKNVDGDRVTGIEKRPEANPLPAPAGELCPSPAWVIPHNGHPMTPLILFPPRC